jgi:hypothetical protein
MDITLFKYGTLPKSTSLGTEEHNIGFVKARLVLKDERTNVYRGVTSLTP